MFEDKSTSYVYSEDGRALSVLHKVVEELGITIDEAVLGPASEAEALEKTPSVGTHA